jgi:hypothetical protein
MHAVIVRVTIDNLAAATSALQNQVVPGARQAPGFQAGYWTRAGNSGLSMVVFDSEDAANAAAGIVRSAVPPGVTVEDVEVREVVAQA